MEKPSWILFLGTYPPRECGIATFTRDLSRAVEQRHPKEIKAKILALNKNGTNIYRYPKEVIFQMRDNDITDYIAMAKKINKMRSVKLISVQHEFGIFGGEYGCYLITLLELLKKPAIITFHSVLPNPTPPQKKIVQALAEKSEGVVVMTPMGVKILREVYGIKSDIQVIPHGIPDISLCSPQTEKKRLGFENKILVSSHGLVSPDKGYEYIISALPNVVKKYPNLLYLIIGETHPVIRKMHGEKYRNFLEKKVKQLKLSNNVKFYNKYLPLEDIVSYLKASDICVISNNNPNQITSGTLAYSLGAGRPVVSTPFLHAKDCINKSTGMLVSFKNPKSFEKALLTLLESDELRKEMGRVAYAETRKMTWQNVAIAYLDYFNKKFPLTEKFSKMLPTLKLNHLFKITDDFGIIQFSKNTKPDITSGYTLDDNARALLFCSNYYSRRKSAKMLKHIGKYLSFLGHIQQQDGSFYNLVNENKEIDFSQWSNDAHGRAIWALGSVIANKNIPQILRDNAREMLLKSISKAQTLDSPRSLAFMIIGLCEYLKVHDEEKILQIVKGFGDRLVGMYNENASEDWKWFERYLTYTNGKLPESLFVAYNATKNEEYLKVATDSLNFLVSTTFEGDQFAPIGHDGWYYKNKKKTHFDQQPVDAYSMVQALMVAYNTTKMENYLEHAHIAFDWFLGNNETKCSVYDEVSGGCHDGLGMSTVNLNEGAESTLSYLLARLCIENKGMDKNTDAENNKEKVNKLLPVAKIPQKVSASFVQVEPSSKLV